MFLLPTNTQCDIVLRSRYLSTKKSPAHWPWPRGLVLHLRTTREVYAARVLIARYVAPEPVVTTVWPATYRDHFPCTSALGWTRCPDEHRCEVCRGERVLIRGCYMEEHSGHVVELFKLRQTNSMWQGLFAFVLDVVEPCLRANLAVGRVLLGVLLPFSLASQTTWNTSLTLFCAGQDLVSRQTLLRDTSLYISGASTKLNVAMSDVTLHNSSPPMGSSSA